ncbi:hypothetical protein [Thiomonas sp.]
MEILSIRRMDVHVMREPSLSRNSREFKTISANVLQGVTNHPAQLYYTLNGDFGALMTWSPWPCGRPTRLAEHRPAAASRPEQALGTDPGDGCNAAVSGRWQHRSREQPLPVPAIGRFRPIAVTPSAELMAAEQSR